MIPFGISLGREEPRYRTERLKQIVASLPPTFCINPLAVLALFLPFAFWRPTFGEIPLSHLAIAFAVHACASAVAYAIWRHNRDGIADETTVERELIALQVALSTCWGIVAWLFWVQGNGINNIYVTMVMTGVIWAVMYNRLAHSTIFLAGLLPAMAVFWGRIMLAPGPVPSLLATFVPIWALYVGTMGVRGRSKIDHQLSTQFANEDLHAALRASTEQALQKRYEAEAANSAKTTFLANMSHELRTPLNAILGFSEIIAEQTMGPGAMERYSEYARDIGASGSHLLSLINDLLDVAKIEAGRMEIDARPLDLLGVVESVERLMAPRAGARNQTIRRSMERDLPRVVADDRALRQILLNLVSNAVKFTPAGGWIEIACHRAPQGGIVLAVSDNGPGIAPERRARVFQPFSQIDNRYGRASGGTGLGLALVKGLTELHGGRAWIDGAPGEGTTVSVYFPVSVEVPALAQSATG